MNKAPKAHESGVDDPKSQDAKARRILQGASKVFSEKGYHHASMRDIARETGISLAGMYYYFSSKEEMLYSIQRCCFRQVLEGFQRRMRDVDDPQKKLRVFVLNHLTFFIDNVREMKVLSHESESLTGSRLRDIQEMKRRYYRELREILRALPDRRWDASGLRGTTLSIFGMLNWIYTWYTPERDGAADRLADTMCDLVLHGVLDPAT